MKPGKNASLRSYGQKTVLVTWQASKTENENAIV